jgi:Holliday junction resolvasome RuvABC DNA-binding subunit
MPEDKAFFTSNNSCDRTKQEAISALCALGYKPQDASKMVQGINNYPAKAINCL